MNKLVTITICILLTTTAYAQKKRIGFYNQDSLLQLMPGYQAFLDSTRKLWDTVHANLETMEKQKMAKLKEIDSCKAKDSPLIHQLRISQIQQINTSIEDYRKYSALEIRSIDSSMKAPYEAKFVDAKNQATSEAGCDVAYKESVAKSLYKPEEAEFIDLNKAIAAKLK